jgi:hypothetical protein
MVEALGIGFGNCGFPTEYGGWPNRTHSAHSVRLRILSPVRQPPGQAHGLDPRRSMSAYRPTNDNWSSRFTALAPVQFESLWESGVTTSLRGGAGTAHRSGVASAWGKSLGRTPGGAWRELGEELEKSSGRNVAKARGGARSKAGSNDSRGSGKKSSFRLVGAPDWKPREGRGDKTPRGTRRELGEKSLSGPSSCEKK